MGNLLPSAAGAAPGGETLAALCSAGWQHLEEGDPAAACRAFQRLIAAGAGGAADPLRTDVHETLCRAVQGLAECLPVLVTDPEARHTALQALFGAYQADVGPSANGLAKDAAYAMLRHALGEERRQLAAWVRSELAVSADAELAEHYWRLFLDLAALDPASLSQALADCRAAGHPGLVAEKLLDLDRVGEALLTARRELHEPEALLRFADSPAAHGQVRAIMALVEERLARGFEACLARWLADRYAERGDLAQALDVRIKLLRIEPSDENLEAVRHLARRLGQWEGLQRQVRRLLRGRR